MTGRVFGDESRFDSLRGGPDSELRHLDLGGAAERALLQPRPGQHRRLGVPGQPAGVRGRAASTACWRPVACRCAARLAPGRAPSGPRCAGERRVAADGAADQAHQQALGQLLRGDAREGPGAAGAGARHHGGRGEARRRLRPPAGARARAWWTARGSRAATAPRRYSVVRLLSALVRAATATTSSWPRCRSPAATARSSRPDAQRARRAAAATRKTGTLSDVSALSGYCRGALRRHLRVLVPDERRVADQRAGASRTAWSRRSRPVRASC